MLQSTFFVFFFVLTELLIFFLQYIKQIEIYPALTKPTKHDNMFYTVRFKHFIKMAQKKSKAIAHFLRIRTFDNPQ